MDVKTLRTVSKWLVLVGALNWGLVGFFGFNLVTTLFGGLPSIEKIVYILVGLAGTWGTLAKLGVVSGDKSDAKK